MVPGLHSRLVVLHALLLLHQLAVAVEPAGNRNYAIDDWQVEQGLPDNTVTSIAQTPDGYLWFGTFNGLVRFDGMRFKVFDSRTPGLESERVLRLFADGQGGLWVSMEQGQLARYVAGRFTAFHAEDGWPMEPILHRCIGLDRSGAVVLLTGRGNL